MAAKNKNCQTRSICFCHTESEYQTGWLLLLHSWASLLVFLSDVKFLFPCSHKHQAIYITSISGKKKKKAQKSQSFSLCIYMDVFCSIPWGWVPLHSAYLPTLLFQDCLMAAKDYSLNRKAKGTSRILYCCIQKKCSFDANT